MSTSKNWDKVRESKERINRDHKRGSRVDRQKGTLTEEFQESMREDKRGPTEGMEPVAAKQ